MAQVRLDLSKFKASGVYTIEIDASENILVNPQTIRLVVGFSKKGPFNAPVYCPDIKTAKAVFGDIDQQLERKGSFFHRSLFTCLQTGPVFALSLLALNNDQTASPDTSDTVTYKSFSLDTAETNGNLSAKLLSSFYNKERFWFPAADYFLATVGAADDEKFLHMTNLGKVSASIIVRKGDVKGYDITVKEWYTGIDANDKPAWLNDYDYISDFFVEVLAIEGDWTNYATLSADPVYSAYFNYNGIKKEQLENFLDRPEISLVARITGCLIPDFKDKNGSNQYIQTLLNNVSGITGIFSAVNDTAFDNYVDNSSKVDLIGSNLISAIGLGQQSFEFLSYKAPLINDYAYTDESPTYFTTGSPYDTLEAAEGTPLYDDWVAGLITDGDYIVKNGLGTKQYLQFISQVDGLGDPYVEVRAFADTGFVTQEDIEPDGGTYDSAGAVVASGWNIVSLYGTYNQYLDVVPTASLGDNEVVMSNANALIAKVGGYLVADTDTDRLTRITKISKYSSTQAKVTTLEPIKVYSSNRVQYFQNIQEFVQEYQFYYLRGFSLKESHLPNGFDSRMNEILDVMFNTNIAEALKSKDLISFRYIVDTFWGGLEPNSKWRLAKLAKDRQKCLALINTPTMTQFLNSVDPSFTDAATASDPKPLLNTRYIADGGNLALNPSFTYTLADETLGAKYAGYFSPNLVLRINGRNVSVPPAAHVSNLFIEKFLNGTPYAIVAGPRRGVIKDPNLVGLEYDFSDLDRENLEPFGWNPIVRRRGVGIMIYGNNTGYQKVNSALNSLHVRDLLITIEDDIEQILQGYLFEFNEPGTRLEVKNRVDNYLDQVLSGGGIQSYTTICDSSNNTSEIINQRIGIIDVIVEPSIGIHKFINRVTITRSGGATGGGFTIA